MTTTSTPVHCPECNAVVDSNNDTCPNCGHALKLSLIEQEALQFKSENLASKRKSAIWAKVALVTLTLIFFGLFLTLYYINLERYKTENAVEVLIIIAFLFVIHLSLTILCYYKPLTATIAGLTISTLIIATALFEGGGIANKEDTIFLLVLLLFPAAYIKTIYDLTKTKKLQL